MPMPMSMSILIVIINLSMSISVPIPIQKSMSSQIATSMVMCMPMQIKIASPRADNRPGGMREAIRITCPAPTRSHARVVRDGVRACLHAFHAASARIYSNRFAHSARPIVGSGAYNFVLRGRGHEH